MTLEELKIVISAQTDDLRKELDQVKKQLAGMQNETKKSTSEIQNAFKKMLGGIIALGIGKKIGEAIFGGIKEAMNVEAAIQQIKRIMGESSNQFLKWADTQATAFNMSKGQAITYGSIFGNLVSGFSGSAAEITKNTEDVLKASSIIASSTGRTMDDVMERIRSGLLGNTESIEDLGVNVNVAMIQSTEAFKKFANGKSWDQLDFQIQQQIRLMAILEQTTKKYGDTVNQNTSTQLAQLVAQLNNIKLSLGQAFLPILNIILPILSSFASGLAFVMNIISQFTQVLFGKTIGKQQAQNTNTQAKAMTNLGNATEKAGKQARSAIASFDEINQLQKDSGDNIGLGSSGITAPIGTTPLSFETNAPDIMTKIMEVAEKVRSFLIDNLGPAFGELKQSIQDTIKSLNDLLSAISPYLLPVAKLGFTVAIETLMQIVKECIQALSGDFKIIGGIADILAGIFTGDTDKMKSGLDKVIKGIGDMGEFIKFVENPVGYMMSVIASKIGKQLPTIFGDAIQNIKNIFSGAADWIKRKWNDFWDFKIPEIPLPHFKINGSLSLNPPSVPKLDIDWYDKGGIFNTPSIIGVGEKRPEFVGALEDLRYLIGNELDKRLSSNSYSSSGDKALIFNFNVGNSTIARIVIDSLNEYARQYGELPIPI